MVRATLHEQEIRRAIGAPGDGDHVVDGVATLDDVHDRCLFWLARPPGDEQRDALAGARDGIVIAPPGTRLPGCRVLETPDPRRAIAQVLELVRAEGRQPPWVQSRAIDPSARISPLAVVEGDVVVGENVDIGPFCTVGPDVSIGAGTRLEAGVRVFPRVAIGARTTIGANAVIGSEGFGYVRDADGIKRRMPQLGGVVIGDDVDVCALAAVQCGAIAATTIEDHAKIDHLVLVAHGARVERGATVTAGTIVGGSAVIGADAWVGINASVRDGRRVGASALVGMDASVQDDLPDDAVARAPRPGVAPRPADDDRAGIGFTSRRRPGST